MKTVEKGEYELSRYSPPIKQIMKDAISNSLSETAFPYQDPSEKIKGGGKKKADTASLMPSDWDDDEEGDNDNNEAEKDNEREVIVFIVGGISFSEIRNVYSIKTNNCYIGSTSIITPNEFLRQLRGLSEKVPPPNKRLEKQRQKEEHREQ